MKIIDSKNLKYDNYPMKYFETFEKSNPKNCILESFDLSPGKIELDFANGSRANIISKNAKGNQEILHIAKCLDQVVGKAYNEILETDF